MTIEINAASDHDVLARTMYGEARGEYRRADGGVQALRAVGHVVMNRVARRTWFGRTIKQVCLKPYQFSCWNQGDINRSLVMEVDHDDALFAACYAAARDVMQGIHPDITYGADHYYSICLAVPPAWASAGRETVRIGRHRFYQLYSAPTLK